MARRRLGELDGGAEGARAIAEADAHHAWLAAQGVRAPERPQDPHDRTAEEEELAVNSQQIVEALER